ncbi:PsbP-related protein [Nodularia harveyana UHCC-0300]|uniref:PsbP-related protein n=1 Tax=Nodularia harveyana UHCC-0300 TaxID=2974287 RepID=A0ABU5UIY4_9CYAN|nr:PsbP-related protein [Nodularia harveyana]MEA5583429.1 PsbP-related protein [Nodularia harveyana UHCC-0300]
MTNVDDGDSLTIRKTTGQEMKISLCGINAPELDQPQGKQSRDALRSLIESYNNQVMVSPIGKERDGRTLAEVFITVPGGKKFLNEEQIYSGNAYLQKEDAGKCPNESALINASKRNTNTATKFKTYVEKDTYSISHPSSWIVQRSSRELVIFSSQKLTGSSEELPLNLIKTDIKIEPTNFEEKINRLNSASEINLGNERRIKEEKLNIGGIEAYRVWGGIDQEINSVLTLFKNNNETISVHTFININNTSALPIIYETHNSFMLLKRN